MLKRFLISWIVGAVSIAAVGYCLVFVVGLIAMIAEWDSFVVALGPIRFMEHTMSDFEVSVGGGEGIIPLALVGGLLNGLGAVYFTSRSRRNRADVRDGTVGK